MRKEFSLTKTTIYLGMEQEYFKIALDIIHKRLSPFLFFYVCFLLRFKHIPKVLHLLYLRMVIFWCLNLGQVSQTAPLSSYRNKRGKKKRKKWFLLHYIITLGRKLPKN